MLKNSYASYYNAVLVGFPSKSLNAKQNSVGSYAYLSDNSKNPNSFYNCLNKLSSIIYPLYSTKSIGAVSTAFNN
jgi:hypothetical protein